MILVRTRSPYAITINEANQTETRLELSIWNGDIPPILPNFIFSQKIPSLLSRSTIFPISEYLGDFIEHLFSGSSYPYVVGSNTNYCNFKYNSFALINNVWTQIGSTVFGIGVSGYVGFKEAGIRDGDVIGENYNTETDIKVLSGLNYSQGDNYITINYSRKDTFQDFGFWGNRTPTISILVNSYTGLPIKLTWYNSQNNVQLSTSTFSTVAGNTYMLNVPIADPDFQDAQPKQYLKINWSSGFARETFVSSENICENKYPPIQCQFVNKDGGLTTLQFFKAFEESLEVKSSSYNVSLPYNYSQFRGQKQTFNTNGTRKLKLNTGWVEEGYKEIIEELMLSENILLDVINPAILVSKNVDFKYTVNTKMINYTLDFEYASNVINDIQ